MQFDISKFKTDEKLFTIHINKNIYTGGTSTFLKDVTNNKIIYKHDKSITHITSTDSFIASSSYDCTVSIINRDNYEVEDVIEGPETEIKCVCFDSTNKWVALTTRGKTVWMCKFDEYIEISKILEDHTEDVKGCIFHQDMFVSYGYDNTIKIYKYFELDESWEMVQNIQENETIWSVVFYNNKMYSSNDTGEISLYELIKGWTLIKKVKLSNLPIHALCVYANNIVCGINLGDLIFLNGDLEIVYEIIKLHDNFINCIHWSEKDKMLGTCSDDCSYCIIKELFV